MNGISGPLLGALLLLSAMNCFATGASASSGRYSIIQQTIDAGGGFSRSAKYQADVSLNFHGGPLASPGRKVSSRPGYIGMLNEPPRARFDLTGKVFGEPSELRVADLLSNDSDPENNRLTVLLPQARTVLGGTVELAGEVILYTPPPAEVRRPQDSFSYIAMDDHGGFAQGRVFLLPVDPARNLRAAERAGNDLTLTFLGVPNAVYQIEMREGLEENLPWSAFPVSARQSAGEDGMYSFTIPMDRVQGYFRTVRVQDPTPVLGLAFQQGQIAMRFAGIPSIQYKLQFRPGFGADQSWRDFPDALGHPLARVADENGIYEFQVPAAEGQGYFRTVPNYP